MKDFLGNELHVGDKVIYCNQSGHDCHMRKGVVEMLPLQREGITDHWVHVRSVETGRISMIEDNYRFQSNPEKWIRNNFTTNIVKYDW